jgi:AcrR family transcriptional regulator
MGVAERRERERQEIREKILDAARELFAEMGYEAVTMRRIAEKIEYSPTAIYFHFQDKTALLRALCDEDFGALARHFQSIARIADPIERLRNIGAAYVEFGLAHPNPYRFMFMTPRPPMSPEESALERGNPEQDAYAFLKATIEEGLAQKRFRPELGDAELLSQVVWEAVHGVISLQIAKCNDGWINWKPVRESAALVVEALIRGLTGESKPEGA